MEYTDHHFGRILEFLEEIGERDNTLVIVVSDNGASSEGGAVGSLNEMFFFNNAPESLEDNLAMIDQLGGVETCNHYPWGWTNAGNTPFRRWKRETYRGGTTDPCIVSWPARITAGGELRAQYAHLIDFVPTVLDALGVQAPESIRGVAQAPIEGVSFAHTFTDPSAPSRHQTQYFEMMGHRAIYHDGWRAVCPWPGPTFTEAAEQGLRFGAPITQEGLAALEASGWELYHLDEDWSETRNVAAEHPEKLAELVDLWWAEAEKYQVLPIDGQVLERLTVEKPTIAGPRDKFVFYPGGASVPFTATPKTYNRPWSITAEVVIPPGGAQGVLLANGGRTGGYTFFVKDQKLYFLYNWLGRDRFWLVSPDPLPEGEVELRYEFEPTGAPDPSIGHGVPARGQLYVNGDLVASIDMPFSVLIMFGTQGLTCGYDGGEPAAPEEYTGAFPFTGTIKRVTIDLSGELIPDTEAELRVAMMRQ